MLVLTRKCDERVTIGDDVEIVVLSVQGQRVKLGIKAAAEKMIRRPEFVPSAAQCEYSLSCSVE